MTRAMESAALRQQVAEEVRALMARRRLSGVKLAKAMGKSQAYVWRRLSGETPFDVDDLETVARIFDVPVMTFFTVNAGGLTGSTNKSKSITYRSIPGRASLTAVPRARNAIPVRCPSIPHSAYRPHVARRCRLASSALFHTVGHSS